MIPKTIHYCWFGGKPLPEHAIKCIDSWKKECPDYKIKEWNESNFDTKICPYVEEAYRAKKWAFVSDYARFWILFNFGGLYFDTDVEIIKPIDDIVARGSFMGCEALYLTGAKNPAAKVAPGLGMAASPGLELYKEILDYYSSLHFILDDGAYNMETVVTYVTNILKSKGFNLQKNEIQLVAGINIYPVEYFCPIDYITGKIIFTENTRTIHHYTASWQNKGVRNAHKIEQIVSHKLGKKIGMTIETIYAFPCIFYEKVKQYGIVGLIKRMFSKF